MSLNTAHTSEGVLLHTGETILIYSSQVIVEFSGQSGEEFSGSKTGKLYLTTHRMVFNNKDKEDTLKSFSFPFVALRDVEMKQPIFGANCIQGRVVAQLGGQFEGEANFKLHFKQGGAIEFGTAMLRAAAVVSRNFVQDAPPPYSPPMEDPYAAPPPAYSSLPPAHQAYIPPPSVFPDQPAPGSVFVTPAPPPYPGIDGYVRGAEQVTHRGGGGGGCSS
eukprot:GFUD01020304.1.p1 GENE.GFUD01020304.1~~GFUD01020304.1.p1  ORF type:complete len:219 (-),score=79.23 GFUD01020304.1:525-1181(-)